MSKTFDLKIAVCVPSHSSWCAAFGQAVCNMSIYFMGADYDGKKEIEVIGVGGSMLPEVRHRLVAEAMAIEATHMLFLDSDMTFPADTLNALLRHNVPVVGANYARRTLPTIPTAFKNDKSGSLYTSEDDKDLVEVSHIGTGCLLIDMRVFTLLDTHAETKGETNGLPFFKFEETPNKAGLIGEDVYFCRKVRDAGIPIYCDQELSWYVGHIGQLTHTHQMTHECKKDWAKEQCETAARIEKAAKKIEAA